MFLVLIHQFKNNMTKINILNEQSKFQAVIMIEIIITILSVKLYFNNQLITVRSYNKIMRYLLCMVVLAVIFTQTYGLPNCLQHNTDFSKCLVCHTGYQLYADKCQMCSLGYISSNRLCIPLNNVINSNQASTSATQLLYDPSFLAALHAMLQTQIQKNFIVQTNPCSQTINGVCVICSTGYTLSNNVCKLAQSTTTSKVLIPSTITPPVAPTTVPLPQTITNVPGLTTDSATNNKNMNGLFYPFFINTPPVNSPNPSSNQLSNTYEDQFCNIFAYNGDCTKCATRYYFSSLRKCTQIDPFCQDYNTDDGVCFLCYTGYYVANDGSCKVNKNLGQRSRSLKINCAKREIRINGSCKKVSDDCLQYDQANGNCLSCYDGYEIDGGQCIRKS